ncbi:MAG: hypothetical protein HC848_01830 [Limnobacter sp.]|nr:hypothetical protein [Limnobacter sp.]
MLHPFIQPGVYAVKTDSAHSFCQQIANAWLEHNHDSSNWRTAPGFTWLTAQQSMPVLQEFLQPHVNAQGKLPRGFDLVAQQLHSVHTPTLQAAPLNVNHTIKALRSLCLLKPNLVLFEHLDHWLQTTATTVEKLHPLAQIRKLSDWAQANEVLVIAPTANDLPVWTSSCSGLASWHYRTPELEPIWWPHAWGMNTQLWNPPEQASEHTHLVLSESGFPSLAALADHVHTLRFGGAGNHTTAQFLHVRTNTSRTTTRHGPLLLRLGADSVFHNPSAFEFHYQHVPPTRWQKFTPQAAPTAAGNALATTLHEHFLPGQLTVLNHQAFSEQGHSLLDLASEWGLSCSISRLSMLNHLSAYQVVRLLNQHALQASILATRTALYLLHLWSSTPTETDLDNWLRTGIYSPLETLFAGQVHYTSKQAQQVLLSELYQSESDINPTDILDMLEENTRRVSDLWEWEQDAAHTRPWLARLPQLLKIDQHLLDKQSPPTLQPPQTTGNTP